MRDTKWSKVEQMDWKVRHGLSASRKRRDSVEGDLPEIADIGCTHGEVFSEIDFLLQGDYGENAEKPGNTESDGEWQNHMNTAAASITPTGGDFEPSGTAGNAIVGVVRQDFRWFSHDQHCQLPPHWLQPGHVRGWNWQAGHITCVGRVSANGHPSQQLL